MIKVVQGSRDKRNLFSSCCVASSLCRYSMGWYLADLPIRTSRRPRAKGEGFSARDCTAKTWHSSPHHRFPSQGRETGFMYPQPGAGAPAGPGLGHLIAIEKNVYPGSGRCSWPAYVSGQRCSSPCEHLSLSKSGRGILSVLPCFVFIAHARPALLSVLQAIRIQN